MVWRGLGTIRPFLRGGIMSNDNNDDLFSLNEDFERLRAIIDQAPTVEKRLRAKHTITKIIRSYIEGYKEGQESFARILAAASLPHEEHGNVLVKENALLARSTGYVVGAEHAMVGLDLSDCKDAKQHPYLDRFVDSFINEIKDVVPPAGERN